MSMSETEEDAESEKPRHIRKELWERKVPDMLWGL